MSASNWNWIPFALATVVSWGLYGAFLNFGAAGFNHDRIKAFLFVGVAYFLVAVLVPLAIIAVNGTGFDFGKNPEGIKWSLVAGILGAAGALTVLFALSLNPLTHNKDVGFVQALTSMNWQFYVGLIMAATGGALVTLFK
jgi:hypothetical protein